MPGFFLQLLQAYGLDVFQIALITYLFWKLHANHLKHIIEKIDTNIKETKCIKNEIIGLKERVSRLEGRFSSPQDNEKF